MNNQLIPPQTCFLDIIGVQEMNGESTSVETHCECTVSRRDSKLYIQYIEDDVSRLVTVNGSHVQLRALGDMASRLEFDPVCPTSGEYHTPYGTISMQIFTSVLTVSDRLDEGREFRLYMEYELRSDGNTISSNKLELKVRTGTD